MGVSDRIATLKAELQKTLMQLDKSFAYYQDFRKDFPENELNSKNYDLVILADIITDYYTCLETAFVRISKFFENSLENDRWHKHLLEKMVLDIPGIRKAVLRNESYNLLDEFLRFRHFKRYYYDFNYDKDRMEYLEMKFHQSLPMVREDIQRFLVFLDEVGT
jgi:hypothetical protein